MVNRPLIAASFLLAVTAFAGAADTRRIEGVITAVHQNDFVLDSDGRRIVVDVSSLGGVTAAVAEGQRIAVIGTMAASGQEFTAVRLVSATSPR